MTRDINTDLPNSREVVHISCWIFITILQITYRMLRRPDGTFNRDLAEFHERKSQPNLSPVDGVFTHDALLKHSGGPHTIVCRIFRKGNSSQTTIVDVNKPLGSEVIPVIVFFHGGSFVHSSPTTTCYDYFCRNLVRACNVLMVSVDYRRAPEHRCPAAYEDGFTALRWVYGQPWLRSGVDQRAHIYLMGDSSGGNIAHHVALRAAESGLGIAGNILLNAMFGGIVRTPAEGRMDGKYFVTVQDRDWYWDAFLPEGANRDHLACNPFGPNAIDLRDVNFPRSLVVVSEFDLLRDWQMDYYRGLERADKDVRLEFMERATVGFYMMPINPNYFKLMNAINSFVRPNP